MEEKENCGGAGMTTFCVDARWDLPFSITWLKSELISRCPVNPVGLTLRNWKARTIGEDKGMLSRVAQIKLEWSESAEIPDSVVVKIPSPDILRDVQSGDVSAEAIALLAMSHNRECQFYALWTATAPPLPIPRCFLSRPMSASEEGGLLVLSDLSALGGTVPFYDGLSLPQLFSVAESLAKFHAWCFTHQDIVSQFPAPEKETLRPMFDFILGACKDMKKTWPAYFDPLIDLALETCTSIDDLYYNHTAHLVHGLPAVLVESELWVNNLLFRFLPGGGREAGPELLAVLDWQHCHAGSPADDLCRLLWSSVDADLRRSSTTLVLAHYHAALIAASAPAPPPFSLATLSDAFQFLTQYALLFGLAFTGFAVSSDHKVSGIDKPAKLDAVLCRAKAMLEDGLDYYENLYALSPEESENSEDPHDNKDQATE